MCKVDNLIDTYNASVTFFNTLFIVCELVLIMNIDETLLNLTLNNNQSVNYNMLVFFMQCAQNKDFYELCYHIGPIIGY